jgi:hypothetical protein
LASIILQGVLPEGVPLQWAVAIAERAFSLYVRRLLRLQVGRGRGRLPGAEGCLFVACCCICCMRAACIPPPLSRCAIPAGPVPTPPLHPPSPPPPLPPPPHPQATQEAAGGSAFGGSAPHPALAYAEQLAATLVHHLGVRGAVGATDGVALVASLADRWAWDRGAWGGVCGAWGGV